MDMSSCPVAFLPPKGGGGVKGTTLGTLWVIKNLDSKNESEKIEL